MENLRKGRATITDSRLARALREERFEYAAYYLVLGVFLLLREVPEGQNDAFLQSMETDPDFYYWRLIELVEAHVYAGG